MKPPRNLRVFYNPNHPTESSLDRRLDTVRVASVFAGLSIFISVGVGVGHFVVFLYFINFNDDVTIAIFAAVCAVHWLLCSVFLLVVSVEAISRANTLAYLSSVVASIMVIVAFAFGGLCVYKLHEWT